MANDIIQYIFSNVGDPNLKPSDISLLVCLSFKCIQEDEIKVKINRDKISRYIGITPKTMDNCLDRLDIGGCVTYEKKRGRYGGTYVTLEFMDDLLEGDDPKESKKVEDLPTKVTPINETYNKSKNFPADEEQIRKLIKSEYPKDSFHNYSEIVDDKEVTIASELKEWIEYKVDIRDETVNRKSLIRTIRNLHTMMNPVANISTAIRKEWKNIHDQDKFDKASNGSEDSDYLKGVGMFSEGQEWV